MLKQQTYYSYHVKIWNCIINTVILIPNILKQQSSDCMNRWICWNCTIAAGACCATCVTVTDGKVTLFCSLKEWTQIINIISIGWIVSLLKLYLSCWYFLCDRSCWHCGVILSLEELTKIISMKPILYISIVTVTVKCCWAVASCLAVWDWKNSHSKRRCKW